MLFPIIERLRQKYRTVPYPKGDAVLPARFLGVPHISEPACHAITEKECVQCINVCPTGAISKTENGLQLDCGLCTFCGDCAKACPHHAITFTREYRMASSSREGLLIHPSPKGPEHVQPLPVHPYQGKAAAALCRSFKIREVAAAGCNACEADCNVLGTIVFDLPRFGIDYVASPRHADAMLVTGPVPRNMQLAMHKCHAVIPTPKLVIATGTCAISGGLFRNLETGGKGVSPHIDVDLFIPGCPPHPYTILDGLLRFLGKIPPL